MVAQVLDGSVDLRFEPEGVEWRLSAPLNGIVAPEEARSGEASPELLLAETRLATANPLGHDCQRRETRREA